MKGPQFSDLLWMWLGILVGATFAFLIVNLVDLNEWIVAGITILFCGIGQLSFGYYGIKRSLR